MFRFAYILLVPVVFTFSCTWMNSDTASAFARERVLSEKEAEDFLNLAVSRNDQTCPTLIKPGLMLIDSGYSHVLGRPFYYRDSLNLCFLAILSTPCPAVELSDTEARDLYRAVLKACNPRPFEP